MTRTRIVISTMYPARPARRMCAMHWQTVSDLARRTRASCSAMLPDFGRRADIAEIMDDLSRPEAEFAAAYRELEIINKKLGGVRAVQRFLPPVPQGATLLILD